MLPVRLNPHTAYYIEQESSSSQEDIMSEAPIETSAIPHMTDIATSELHAQQLTVLNQEDQTLSPSLEGSSANSPQTSHTTTTTTTTTTTISTTISTTSEAITPSDANAMTSPISETVIKRHLSIEKDTKEFMLSMSEGKMICDLTFLHIITIEIMDVIKSIRLDIEFMRDKWTASGIGISSPGASFLKGFLLNITFQFYGLFAELRFCSEKANGELIDKNSLIAAGRFYSHLAVMVSSLVNIAENSQLTSAKCNSSKLENLLKRIGDILNSEDLLLAYLAEYKSSVINPTPQHIELYKNALGHILYSSTILHTALEKNFIVPLENAIKTIEETSIINLSHLKKLLEQYLECLKGPFTAGFQATKLVIVEAQSSRLLGKISKHFESQSNQNLLAHLDEIFPLMKTMAQPWKTYETVFAGEIAKWQALFPTSKEKALFSALKTAIKKINKLLKNKTTNTHCANLKTLSETLAAMQNEGPFYHIYNFLVAENMRIPQIIKDILVESVTSFHPTHQLGQEFRRSLMSDKYSNPCSSFKAFDFFLFQVTNFLQNLWSKYETISCEKIDQILSDISLATDLLQKIVCLSYVTLSEYRNIFSTFEQDQSRLCSELIGLMRQISNPLQRLMEQDTELAGELPKSLHAFAKYLHNHESLPFFNRHLLAVLFTSLNNKHEITHEDLPLIKEYFTAMVSLSNSVPVAKAAIEMKKCVKKHLQEAPASGQHFWKLNWKYAVLLYLEITKFSESLDQYNAKIQACKESEELMDVLKSWYAGQIKWGNNINFTGSQITMAFNVLNATQTNGPQEQKNIPDIQKPFYTIANWLKGVSYVLSMVKDLLQVQGLSQGPETEQGKKVPQPKEKVSDSIRLEETNVQESSEDEVEAEELAPLSIFTQPMVESAYLSQLELLHQLKQASVTPIQAFGQSESRESYFSRRQGIDNLAANSAFHLTLIEEGASWDHSSNTVTEQIAARMQSENLLLLEDAEKLNLCFAKVVIQEAPERHYITSIHQGRPLLFTHDGTKLVNSLGSKQNKHFAGLDDLIGTQKMHLQEIFWFKRQNQQLLELAKVRTCCEQIWLDISLKSKERHNKHSKLCEEARNYLNCQSRIHKLKQIRATVNSISNAHEKVHGFKEKLAMMAKTIQDNGKCDPQCQDLAIGLVAALERVLSLNDALDTAELPPMNLAMRSAEIQVSLLSLTAQLLLCYVKVPAESVHPLFLNADGKKGEGRPLMYCHRADKILSVLQQFKDWPTEEYTALKACLHAFAGDPRYPFPNKSALTNDLIAIYQKVYLQHKVNHHAFFDMQDKKLLQRHLGAGTWQQPAAEQKSLLSQSLQADMQKQKAKTTLAFDLACQLFGLFGLSQ